MKNQKDTNDFYELQKLIGMNLARIRNQTNLSQVDFAEKIDINRQIIGRLEGKNVKDKSISLEMIFNIAINTHTDIREFFDGFGELFLKDQDNSRNKNDN